jgi:hypothetical protein
VSVDATLERLVVAEMALRARRIPRRSPFGSSASRALAQTLHAGHHDLLMHLRRVASTVPDSFRRVAWLHHASVDGVTTGDLEAAGLTSSEVDAVQLLTVPLPACDLVPPDRVLAIVEATGMGGYLARVVARAALSDHVRVGGRAASQLTALRVLGGTA